MITNADSTAGPATKSWRWRTIAMCLTIGGLAGCTTPTPGPYTQQVNVGTGSAITIDAKQRVVFTHDLPATAGGRRSVVTCAEPSPDALTALGTSNALSFNIGGTTNPKALNLSNSVTEGAAFVGLRTQSIQLLRDAMYRLCEGYASGGMDDAEFKAMQRRFQSTIMGLIAIEQLTGPVVAGQAMLFANAQSQSGAGQGDAQVTDAKSALATERSKLTEAEQLLIEKEAAVKTAQSAIDQNKAALAVAERDGLADTVKSLRDAQPELNTRLADAKTERDKTLRAVNDKREDVRIAEANLQTAQSRASSAASSSGNMRDAIAAHNATTETLAQTVRLIVDNVNNAYTRDECVEVMSRMAYGSKNFGDIDARLFAAPNEEAIALEMIRSLRDICAGVVKASIEERTKELGVRLQDARAKAETAEKARIDAGLKLTTEASAVQATKTSSKRVAATKKTEKPAVQVQPSEASPKEADKGKS